MLPCNLSSSYHVNCQRVLEHCDDPTTQQIMMDEILQSVCLLAQDQYGNYVVQVSDMHIFSKIYYMPYELGQTSMLLYYLCGAM